MSVPGDAEHPDTLEALEGRIRKLEADLQLARTAAAEAEAAQGRLRGELKKVTEEWVAACHAQEQWDILFSENVEDLRLANERVETAERRRREIEESTTWRVVQAGLAPYRRLRGLR